ncbi:MAG: DUF2807 domain-containing protein [Defluviitaleaceae bacterium]|nr:DUF2807 domain-containing protein [Defluviitaleaceae bacterium]
MKKKVFAFISLAVITAMLSGCMVVSLGTGNISAIDVQGTGPMTSRTFETEAFNTISIGSSFVVTYRQSNTHSAVIEMQDNLFQHLEFSVHNGVLTAGPSGFSGTGASTRVYNFNTTNANRPRIYIYAPYLEAASFSGAIDGGDWDTVVGQSFEISAAGVANLNIPLEVETLAVSIAGAGGLEFSGHANAVDISVAGAGNVSAFNLLAQDVSVSIAGAGNADVNVSDSLDASISGVGRVRYMGDPANISQSVAGMGTVERY